MEQESQILALDDAFLVEVGLADRPESQRGPFLMHVYATLESRM